MTGTSPRNQEIRVLLIEDNPLDAHLVQTLMERSDDPPVFVEHVVTLANGLERLQDCPFDVVVLDLFLPDALDLDGLRRIRTANPRLPIVVLTGKDDTELGAKAVALGAQDYLSKHGVEPDALLRALRFAIERKTAQEREGALVHERATRETAEVAQERIRSILDSITDGFFAVDDNWMITFLNAKAEALLERPTERLLGHNLWDLEASFLGREFFHYCHRAARERVSVEFERHTTQPDRWLQVRAYPRDGGVTVYLCDITEKKQFEAALQRSQTTLQTILEASPDVVMVLGPECLFRWVSPAVSAVLGYDAPLLAGRSILGLMPAEDRDIFISSIKKAGSDEIRLRFRLRHADQHWVPMEARGRRFDDGGVPAQVLIVRDVQDQDRLVQSLRSAQELARLATLAKANLLSRASHELKTPLNAILGFAQLLEMDLIDPEGRESIEQILRSSRHLLGLIENLLDIAGAERGDNSIRVEPVCLREVIGDVLAAVQPLADSAGVELAGGCETCERSVSADGEALRGVLTHLVRNAVQYNHRGGKVEVICRTVPGNLVRVEVRDNGKGIAAEKLDRLFGIFDRLDVEKIAGSSPGVGLGLAVSKALADAMGGRIGAESVEGEGSAVWIELPKTETLTLEPDTKIFNESDTDLPVGP